MNVFSNNENIARNITGLIKKKSMKNLKESITKEKTSGVYKIVSPTGKIYIGQSLNIWARMGIYKNGWTHNQPKLHRSFNKYGFENHIFYLLEICSQDIILERETFYKQQMINELGWDKTLFCDLHDQGSGPRSEETCRKLSEGKKGIKHSKPHSNKGVPKPNFMTEEIKEKIKLANQKPKPPRNKEHNEKIGLSHLGKPKGHKGRISPMKGKTQSFESREKARLNNLGKNNKVVLQFDVGGNFIKEWESQTIAAQSLGKKTGAAIGQCAKGKYNVIYGYKWKYKN